jgi:hypothetical protein
LGRRRRAGRHGPRHVAAGRTWASRETYGEWTNVWWAKTDDDSGNTGVYVSGVYLKGGNYDQPVPGLPVC